MLQIRFASCVWLRVQCTCMHLKLALLDTVFKCIYLLRYNLQIIYAVGETAVQFSFKIKFKMTPKTFFHISATYIKFGEHDSGRSQNSPCPTRWA